MTPSSPGPTRPFYPIDDPEHPAPRDGAEIHVQWKGLVWVRAKFTDGKWMANKDWEVFPEIWRPILDAETGGKEVVSKEVKDLCPNLRFVSSPPPAPSATPRTMREIHEEAAGMGLDELFFKLNHINPNHTEVEHLQTCLTAALARAEQAESNAKRNMAIANGFYKTIVAKMCEYFEEGDRGLDWDVIPSTIAGVCKARDDLQRQLAEAKARNDEAVLEVGELNAYVAKCNAALPIGFYPDSLLITRIATMRRHWEKTGELHEEIGRLRTQLAEVTRERDEALKYQQENWEVILKLRKQVKDLEEEIAEDKGTMAIQHQLMKNGEQRGIEKGREEMRAQLSAALAAKAEAEKALAAWNAAKEGPTR